jgi:integrase
VVESAVQMSGSSVGGDKGPFGKRIYRRRVIGTVCQYADVESARKSVAGLLAEINGNGLEHSALRMAISEVCDHFIQRELTNDNLWRSYATKRAYKAYLKRWIVPHWGCMRLSEVRTMEVESWLRRLPLAKSSCAKIRSILSVLFNHACRHETVRPKSYPFGSPECETSKHAVCTDTA